MSHAEEVRMDKLSERVRKMVGEWRNEVAKRNRLGIGPSGGMAFAYERCADALETLLPQIEALEQRRSPICPKCSTPMLKGGSEGFPKDCLYCPRCQEAWFGDSWVQFQPADLRDGRRTNLDARMKSPLRY